MKHLNKSSASAIAIEIISIIIAVVLGFIVNEWREVIHNKSTANSALKRITSEIENNYVQLKEKQKYYLKMKNALDSLEAIYGNHVFDSDKIPGWSGLNPPLLSSSSYQTASTIGVFSFIDFDTADQISKVYLLQEYLQQLGATTINTIISGEFQKSRSVKLVFIVHKELVDGLMDAYQCALSQSLKRYSKNFMSQE